MLKKLTKQQEPTIEPGVLVTVQGRVHVPKTGYTDDYYDDTAKVLSVSPDGNTVELSIDTWESVKGDRKPVSIKASTWIGNVSYFSKAPKYDKGDVISLKPVKIIDYEIYGNDDVRYVIDIDGTTVEIPENMVSQVLSKG